MRSVGKILAMVVLLGGAARGQDTLQLTLAAAHKLAIQNNPQLTASRYTAEAAAQVSVEIGAAFQPTFFGSVTGVGADGGIVHQDLALAVFRIHLSGQGVDRSVIGDINRCCTRLQALLEEPGRRSVRLGVCYVGEDDGGTFFGQTRRNAKPDPLRSSRDHRDPALEPSAFIHLITPRSVSGERLSETHHRVAVTSPAQSLGSFCSCCSNLLRCKIIRRPSAYIKKDESLS